MAVTQFFTVDLPGTVKVTQEMPPGTFGKPGETKTLEPGQVIEITIPINRLTLSRSDAMSLHQELGLALYPGGAEAPAHEAWDDSGDASLQMSPADMAERLAAEAQVAAETQPSAHRNPGTGIGVANT
jgi:hypothetical protein